MFWISRFAQFFIYPDTWGIFGTFVAVYLYKKNRPQQAARVALISSFAVIIPAIPWVSWKMMQVVERAYIARPIHDYPSADAILVLGGTVARVAPPRYEPEEIGGSRILPAVRLYKLGKAKKIVVAGGDPYPGLDGKMRSQAVDMRDVMVDMGVPSEAIILQGDSRNTEEDILFSSRILKEAHAKTVLLVTNAFHMKRAMVLAQKSGIEWIPVPTGYEAPDMPLGIMSFIPGFGYIRDTNRALKEFVGLQYARWRIARRPS